MRIALVLTLLLASACSSLLGIEDGTERAIDAGADVPILRDVPIVSFEVFVSLDGDDQNDGSLATPVRSITAALAIAANNPSTKILVEAGVYDAIGGEQFPLVIPMGVTVVGQGELILIEAVGVSPIFDVQGGAIDRITIETNGDAITAGEGAQIDDCTVNGGVVGLRISAPNVTVTNSDFMNGDTGLIIDGQGTLSLFSGNSFLNNEIGVRAVVDATFGSDNQFSCNSNADLLVTSGSTVSAEFSRWDHLPPTDANLGGGVDIVRQGGSTVVSTNPALADSPCP